MVTEVAYLLHGCEIMPQLLSVHMLTGTFVTYKCNIPNQESHLSA